jgi:hypothetical protein
VACLEEITYEKGFIDKVIGALKLAEELIKQVMDNISKKKGSIMEIIQTKIKIVHPAT